jgi:hypothetical protein
LSHAYAILTRCNHERAFGEESQAREAGKLLQIAGRHHERRGSVARGKKQALSTWEQDARQMMTASNEGMAGNEEGLDQDDSHRLGEVVRAKAKIGAQPKLKQSH